MELELKHLAPYLPYELIVEDLQFDFRVKLMGIKKPNEDMRFHKLMELSSFKKIDIMYKPILRPLSDLTKEIEHNGKKFIPMNGFFREASEILKKELEITRGKIMPEFLSYQIVSKLFEWHFDVFGLIDEGLAIDINIL